MRSASRSGAGFVLVVLLAQDRVDRHILSGVGVGVARTFASQHAFARHAQLLHHPPGLDVRHIGFRADSREIERLECPAHPFCHGFGDEALPPVFSSDAVSELGGRVARVDFDVDRAGDLAVQADREDRGRAPGREYRAGHVFDGVLVLVWAGQRKKPSPLGISRVGVDIVDIRELEWAQHQSRGPQCQGAHSRRPSAPQSCDNRLPKLIDSSSMNPIDR